MIRDQLAGAALVVAHPDDEILWFSSIFRQVRKIFITYLEAPGLEALSLGRRAVEQQFALPNVEFIGLTESMTFKCADWAHPIASAYGLELNADDDSQRLPGCDPARYVANFELLRNHLRTVLQGYRLVFTHNPWGEYGHEDHVQVYRAVTSLRAELGFDVWFDNYASDRSSALMARTLAKTQYQHEIFATCPDAAREIEALYRQHDCWTWPFADYQWPDSEAFARDVEVQAGARHAGATLPINFINVDQAALQSVVPSRIERLAQRLTRWKRRRRR